jgi:hypothetical protein
LASSGFSARIVAASGTVNLAPVFTRFMLPWMKASGLARHIATIIW